jgi:hypothetical protein
VNPNKEFYLTTVDEPALIEEMRAAGAALVDDSAIYEAMGEPISKNPNLGETVFDSYLAILRLSQFGLIPSLVRTLQANKKVNKRTLNRIIAEKGLDKSLVWEEEIASKEFVQS